MRRRAALGVGTMLLLGAVSACAGGGGGQPSLSAADARERAARAPRPPVNEADVRFMSGMIHHHAQAVVMARWAPSHGASEALQRFCERIVVAQQDEIQLMSTWLADRGQPVPDTDPAHGMHGMDHSAMMPGMLSAEQLERLDAARGAEFDRLFLTYMIQHHEGAIVMVDELFGSYGGGQDETVFRLASDIYADQTTEIDRMHTMLDAMP
ncbi:MAG: DUF305 domain-containing protein [Gemmatimonadota bacterium]